MLIEYNGQQVEMNDAFSGRDFTGRGFVDVKNGANVYGSCFSCETPDTPMFKPNLIATFYNCNLDNCLIPLGCTVVGGTQRRYKVQADGEDWLLDQTDKPTTPINTEFISSRGGNIDPKKIAPVVPVLGDVKVV